VPWTKIVQQQNINKGKRILSYKDAIKEGISQAMDNDPSVFVIGVDVDDRYGIFGTTLELKDKERVIGTPISENGMTGVALGAALAGMRPIHIHMRPDFMMMAMDQIVNHVAKWRYMFHGKTKVPIVIRAIIGRGWGSAAQHSQSLQSFYCHIPGLKVIMPSTPYDVKGLFLSAVADDYPVIFIEHRWLYKNTGPVPEEMYVLPLGKGEVLKEGDDLTIVATSLAVIDALKASEQLDIKAEVIDPKTLRPLDETVILNSVKKTGRLLIVDYDWQVCGFASEISAMVAEKGFQYLKAPIQRITFPECSVPATPILEKTFYPSVETIVEKIQRCFQ